MSVEACGVDVPAICEDESVTVPCCDIDDSFASPGERRGEVDERAVHGLDLWAFPPGDPSSKEPDGTFVVDDDGERVSCGDSNDVSDGSISDLRGVEELSAQIVARPELAVLVAPPCDRTASNLDGKSMGGAQIAADDEEVGEGSGGVGLGGGRSCGACRVGAPAEERACREGRVEGRGEGV